MLASEDRSSTASEGNYCYNRNSFRNQCGQVYCFTINFFRDIYDDFANFGKEVRVECIPSNPAGNFKSIKDNILNFIHIPYLPMLHSPGWLLRYILGPYDSTWLDCIFGDFGAGLTVGLLLIPQGLSYANLANQPPVNGRPLYLPIIICRISCLNILIFMFYLVYRLIRRCFTSHRVCMLWNFNAAFCRSRRFDLTTSR